MSKQTYCTASGQFSIREARAIVRDLFRPNPVIYWTDFLLSMAVGAGCLFVARQFVPPLSATQIVLTFIASLAYYRAALFNHELTHLRHGSFRSFRVAWNVLCGIPFFMPSFLYHTHLAHHARKHYGTPDDGEYLPLAVQPRREIFKYFLQPLVLPALAIVRFLVLAPLAWVSPALRRWVHQRASSMVMDPGYVRPLPTRRELRLWRVQEAACFVFAVVVASLLAVGRLPISLLVHFYLMSVVVLFLNNLRTLGAHRFRHRGEPLTFVDQLLDSVNYPRQPLLNELWAPVGLRFHALHHLFPALPYHALPAAHRRLMEQLPSDSPYRQTESPSLFASIRELWRSAGTASALGAPQWRSTPPPDKIVTGAA
ncbi:MAG: fatty acid desaturase family protein [Pirellulales bacterium]